MAVFADYMGSFRHYVLSEATFCALQVPVTHEDKTAVLFDRNQAVEDITGRTDLAEEKVADLIAVSLYKDDRILAVPYEGEHAVALCKKGNGMALGGKACYLREENRVGYYFLFHKESMPDGRVSVGRRRS